MDRHAHTPAPNGYTVSNTSGLYRYGHVHPTTLRGGVVQNGLEHGLSGVLDQFPLLMAALKEELRREILEQVGQGQWLDQTQSVLMRNRHVRACKRLIRENSPDAYYDASGGRWLLRASAVDREVVRANRQMVASGRLPESVPPPAHAPVPMLAKTEPPEIEPEDETGVWERALLERARGIGGAR